MHTLTEQLTVFLYEILNLIEIPYFLKQILIIDGLKNCSWRSSICIMLPQIHPYSVCPNQDSPVWSVFELVKMPAIWLYYQSLQSFAAYAVTHLHQTSALTL